MQDETFNYSVIKLIVSIIPFSIPTVSERSQVALNEKFMAEAASNIPSANASDRQNDTTASVETKNRVLHVLMRRLGTTKAFGENMIFMLNRASTHSSCQLQTHG